MRRLRSSLNSRISASSCQYTNTGFRNDPGSELLASWLITKRKSPHPLLAIISEFGGRALCRKSGAGSSILTSQSPSSQRKVAPPSARNRRSGPGILSIGDIADMVIPDRTALQKSPSVASRIRDADFVLVSSDEIKQLARNVFADLASDRSWDCSTRLQQGSVSQGATRNSTSRPTRSPPCRRAYTG